MIRFSRRGLFCPQAGISIDPQAGAPCAIVTHAHADHARRGMGMYIAHHHTIPLLRLRIGQTINARGVEYGEVFERNGVRFSLHPAGHVAGSAQVRVEAGGEVWVISGDYKLDDDGVGAPFTAVPCDTFVTESTFGLPIYHWQDPKIVFGEIHRWWKDNQRRSAASVLYCYALGKAQRLLRNLDSTYGPILAGESIVRTTHLLADGGLPLPRVAPISERTTHQDLRNALILLPPSGVSPALTHRLVPFTAAYVSGWMATKSRRGITGSAEGFALSDHADWEGLNTAVRSTGAHRVFVTHGYAGPFARWLRERGLDAHEAVAE